MSTHSEFISDTALTARVAGQKILKLEGVSESGVTLITDKGSIRVDLFGACCSDSYFTDTSQFDELIGATLQQVEVRDGIRDGVEATPSRQDDTDWHFLVFITNKGHTTIDWRNDSNGHYIGSIALSYKENTAA